MTIKINEYTAEEIQQMIDNDRDFTLLNGQNKIVMEIPVAKLKMKLKKNDGILMAENVERKVEDYLRVLSVDDGKAVVAVDVRGTLRGTKYEGMAGKNIKALMNKLGATLKNKSDINVKTKKA